MISLFEYGNDGWSLPLKSMAYQFSKWADQNNKFNNYDNVILQGVK